MAWAELCLLSQCKSRYQEGKYDKRENILNNKFFLIRMFNHTLSSFGL
jgi:hypothetical protein